MDYRSLSSICKGPLTGVTIGYYPTSTSSLLGASAAQTGWPPLAAAAARHGASTPQSTSVQRT
jgi:hypothetical protein